QAGQAPERRPARHGVRPDPAQRLTSQSGAQVRRFTGSAAVRVQPSALREKTAAAEAGFCSLMAASRWVQVIAASTFWLTPAARSAASIGLSTLQVTWNCWQASPSGPFG